MFFMCSFLTIVQVVNSTNTETKKCLENFAVNITDGEHNNGVIQKDGINYTTRDFYTEGDSIFGCVCNIKPCVRKCCGPNEIVTDGCTNANYTFTFDIYNGTTLTPITESDFYVLHNLECDYGHFRLIPNFDDPSWVDNFYVQLNGSLYAPFVDEKKTVYGIDEYCLETFNEGDGNIFSAVICLANTEEPPKIVNFIGMIISMPFLLLTFIAYALLPDRNLHMKALMFYVINLMFSYLLLVIIQLSESQFAEATCKSLGYFCLFFFLVSFFWMNVICIDIWWGFSGLRGFTGSKKTAERKRFLFYCAYAWGMPVLHVLVVFIIDILANQNSVLKPDIGNGQCFLRRGFPELLYFYGPMAILITINIVLFAITAIKIRRIKSETAMLKKEDSKRHSYENDRQIFNLYVKLLFAMGVNWSMEIISWAVIWAEEAPEAIWYLTDFCNAIYGVFIFFIFVFKRSIWKLLKKRYYTFIGKHHLAHSMTMTNTTRVTSYSTATSTIQETAHGGDNDTSTLKHDP
ncbi:G-protein coupled receptor Mth2 isoform X2 [Tribolium castaneum]|uniref:G-protein coupled receptor Mth2 isoform X2 n=1 Tax=Tribolium castaneum TaxID=7070 RepID=UPI00077DDBA9|nr:PREDICTED: G-protein coupled receptor Mth2 isoform X2 [Tribolium castaneum]|eukprot:XP_015840171.1 PREDICTED: G-protein coupled receptor Mth2 isoform X2 [Tribolium castaneum]